MTNPAPEGGDERPPPVPGADVFAADELPPPAVPPPPAYESTPLLDPTPEYDSLAQESALTEPVPSVTSLVESEFDTTVDYTAPAGALAQVKAFAADKPAVFLGLALAAGWLVGKIFSSSDDDDSDDE
jgi:hypothetical protein